AAVLLFIAVWMRNKYLELISSDDFARLFNVVKKRDVIHWQNYTRCRFVGVQHEKRIFSLTQVMLIGGVLPVVLMMIAWIYNNTVNDYIDKTLYLFATLAVFGLPSYLTYRWSNFKSQSMLQRNRLNAPQSPRSFRGRALMFFSSSFFVILVVLIA